VDSVDALVDSVARLRSTLDRADGPNRLAKAMQVLAAWFGIPYFIP
jgi:hypothetical protein